jgi:hypothetical protein
VEEKGGREAQQEELENGGICTENGATRTEKSVNSKVSPNSCARIPKKERIPRNAREFGETLEFALFSVCIAPFSMRIPPLASSSCCTHHPLFLLQFTPPFFNIFLHSKMPHGFAFCAALLLIFFAVANPTASRSRVNIEEMKK